MEKHVRYAEEVEDLFGAWSFVMGVVDDFKAPTVEISPFWTYSEEEDGVMRFSVSVSGLVD